MARLDSGTRLVVEAGNFAARVLTLGAPLREISSSETDEFVEKQLDVAKKEIKQKINDFKLNEALAEIWQLIHFGDRYLN